MSGAGARIFSLCDILSHRNLFSNQIRLTYSSTSMSAKTVEVGDHPAKSRGLSASSKCGKHLTCSYLVEGNTLPSAGNPMAVTTNLTIRQEIRTQKSLRKVQQPKAQSARNKSCADLVRNRVCQFPGCCQASTGRKMVNVSMSPSPIIISGRAPKRRFRGKNKRLSNFYNVSAYAAYGSSNIKRAKARLNVRNASRQVSPVILVREASSYPTGIFCCGLGNSRTTLFVTDSSRGGKSALRTHPSMPWTCVPEMSVKPRFTSASIQPRQVSRPTSKLAVGGATWTVRESLNPWTWGLSVSSRNVNAFGGTGFIAGIVGFAQLRWAAKDSVSRGSCLDERNRNFPAGFEIRSSANSTNNVTLIHSNHA